MKGKVRVTPEQSVILQIEFIKKGFMFINGTFEPFCKNKYNFFYFNTIDVGKKGEPFRVIGNGQNLYLFRAKIAKEYTFNECLFFIENYKV